MGSGWSSPTGRAPTATIVVGRIKPGWSSIHPIRISFWSSIHLLEVRSVPSPPVRTLRPVDRRWKAPTGYSSSVDRSEASDLDSIVGLVLNFAL